MVLMVTLEVCDEIEQNETLRRLTQGILKLLHQHVFMPRLSNQRLIPSESRWLMG